MKKILIINGPNLNLLGKREKEIYGDEGFDPLLKDMDTIAKNKNIGLSYMQSNDEGRIIDELHSCSSNTDFIIINPGALTHYSYSLHDAIRSIDIPAIEVHISNIYKREEWRRNSVISPAVIGVISGLGLEGYKAALTYAILYLNK